MAVDSNLDQSNLVNESISRILSEASTEPVPYTAANMSDSDIEAFRLLVEAGFLWRSSTWRITCPGLSEVLLISTDVTGELPNGELRRRVGSIVLSSSLTPDSWLAASGMKLLHKREVDIQGWLTDEGVKAKQDLEEGHRETLLKMIKREGAYFGATIDPVVILGDPELITANSVAETPVSNLNNKETKGGRPRSESRERCKAAVRAVF